MDGPATPPRQPSNSSPDRRGFDRLIDLAENFSGLLIWALALSISTNVLLRRAFNIDFGWLFETTEYALLILTFVGGAALLRQRGHVGVDLIGEVIFPSAKERVIRIGDILSVVILTALAGVSALIAYRSYLSGQLTTGVVQIPRWWVFAPLPIGFSLMVVQGVRNAVTPPAGGCWRRMTAP